MRTDYTYNGTPWIDLFMPTEDEVAALIDERDLPGELAEIIESPTAKDTVKVYDRALFTVLHFPAFQHSHTGEKTAQEIDFIITKDAVITVHYDTIDAIHKFSRYVRTATALSRPAGQSHQPSQLFFGLIEKLYTSVYNEIEYVESWLGQIEDNIFNGRERDMVYEISRANRRLLDARRIMHLHDNLMSKLADGGEQLFDAGFRDGVQNLRREYQKLHETIKENMVLVDEFRNTNNSLLSTKRNETMQSLTVLANITFPVTMIAALFSMNATHSMPLVREMNDFWIIVTLMVTAILIITSIFKYKRWF